ncbi:MAG: tannase/feruloyl esterase family alpha/beta hydrolase, partial [Rhizobium pusense]|nr:tannase/feruloyl esterase family alpha/beta hydrolase [Agrobacterium pusense]
MSSLLWAASRGVMSIPLVYISALPAVATPHEAQTLCAGIATKEIAASTITLPTTGAKVLSATLVGAADPGNKSGEYCRVVGETRPVDPDAPKIIWQVNLPSAWNGKMLQYGGGGYNGSLPPTSDKTTLGLDTEPTPL